MTTLSTLEATAKAVIERAGNAKSLAWRAADSRSGDAALGLLDDAAGELQLLREPMDRAYMAATSWDYTALGGIGASLDAAERGIAAARGIAEAGETGSNLFNTAFGAVQQLGAARAYARDLAMFAH